MEVKIGIQHLARELSIDTESSAEEVQDQLAKAMAEDGLLTLTDAQGARTMIRADKIAYIELGQEHRRRVGFGSV
ncbi:DUF3107 domain-containing protein [Granulicoccus phenolivorans]|uniref:DUF3107 domain-containing protein n=1 Tax=Granulicoccus phenolivorans TaxID=266854 RepID=UPI0003FD71CE|nr:DUF3107 domain-containing protein [Granulicoccus phenolivorans]